MNILYFLTPKSDTVYINENSTLRQVLEKMSHCGYSALPIVDDEGKYVGTITEGDLLWEIKEKYTLTVKAAESIALRDVRRRRDNEPVNVLSNMEGLIMKVMNQNFVPVVDDRGAFMGIITRRAVIGYLYEKLGVAENTSDKK